MKHAMELNYPYKHTYKLEIVHVLIEYLIYCFPQPCTTKITIILQLFINKIINPVKNNGTRIK